MQRHPNYWLLDKGFVLVFGPVFDPKGPGVFTFNDSRIEVMLPHSYPGPDCLLGISLSAGAGWRIRTPDLLITNQPLYLLS